MVRLLPDDDILQHGERREEHEVLVNHPDAPRNRVARAPDGDFRAVHGNGARVRTVQAVEDLHEGGLAGAVFPHQRVDLSRPQVEADVVVGAHAGKVLG